MNDSVHVDQEQLDGGVSPRRVVINVLLLVSAVIATFLIAASSLKLKATAEALSVLVVGIMAAVSAVYFWFKERGKAEIHQIEAGATGDYELGLEKGLAALDEANEFFAGSLNTPDMFRLVSSRVHGLLPFTSNALFLLNETRTRLKITAADGLKAVDQRGRTIEFGEGLAGRCYLSKRIEIDMGIAIDEPLGGGSSVAIPLRREEEVFGVLEMSSDCEFEIGQFQESILDAIATRVSPMILSSLTFERNQSNALTDTTTDLPNGRAFYLALESHLAESIRHHGERPLAVLTIDIKDFNEINQKYGHAAGNLALSFAGRVIKENLRQMDFIARSIGDEFLAIMPTATKDISQDIIARIHAGFFGRGLKITDTETIEIEVNIGWASFGSDGDTASQMLSAADLRKEQSKTLQPGNVAWFPQPLSR